MLKRKETEKYLQWTLSKMGGFSATQGLWLDTSTTAKTK